MDPHHHPSVRRISECFVKPELLPEESKQPHYLNPWGLAMLSVQYIQKGLLFHKPSGAYHDDGRHFMVTLLRRLKTSLCSALSHFYPLTGRLATITNEDQGWSSVYVDCLHSPGAKFTHAALHLTISDILSPTDVPSVVHSLFDFDLNGALNYDGHSLPLLSIQVTELLDGIFIGSSCNHSIGDGTSHWNFIRTWSEIFQASSDTISISRPPILKQWFPDGYGPIINLPFTHPDQFIKRVKAPKELLRERVFHFSKESIAKLKAKANAEYSTREISSFQSLCAFLWRSITRARRVPQDQITTCSLAANNRGRLEPRLSEDYFGNLATMLRAEAKAGELLEGGLGRWAWKLHEVVLNNTNENLRDALEKWFQSPRTYEMNHVFLPYCCAVGGSPRFDIYGNEFGMGKAVAVRSGCANKYDGKIISYPGYDGGGSVDFEIALFPHTMANLESDSDFMDAVSSPPHLRHH